MKYQLTLVCFLLLTTLFAQRNSPFNGELTYNIERLSPKDSSQAKMLIYAKDSLQKVINFSSTLGRQEMIKHLRLERSYVLVTTTKGKFAIKTKANSKADTLTYLYKKKFGSKRIAGIRAKRLEVSLKGVDKKFIFYYTPKINAKYGAAYQNLPGLVLEYFVATDKGLFKYIIEDISFNEPPLSLFMIPDDFKKVSLEEFVEAVSIP